MNEVLLAYLWASGFLFLFLGAIWTRRRWYNFSIKFIFFVLSFGGFLLAVK